jgi:hypothetical protein
MHSTTICSMAMQRALPPLTLPSAYRRPSLTAASGTAGHQIGDGLATSLPWPEGNLRHASRLPAARATEHERPTMQTSCSEAAS